MIEPRGPVRIPRAARRAFDQLDERRALARVRDPDRRPVDRPLARLLPGQTDRAGQVGHRALEILDEDADMEVLHHGQWITCRAAPADMFLNVQPGLSAYPHVFSPIQLG